MKRALGFLAVGMLLLSGCPSATGSGGGSGSGSTGSSECAITSFTFDGLTCTTTIDSEANTIEVDVPYTVDVDTLVPVIECSSGATVATLSGQDPDFSSTVTYLVTAEDGQTVALYYVTVYSYPSITDFVFDEAVGGLTFYEDPLTDDDGNEYYKIYIWVDPSTDVTSLTPTITYRGATISPASRVAQDFSDEVTYTLTGTDGSSREYRVEVDNSSTVSDTHTLWLMENASDDDVSANRVNDLSSGDTTTLPTCDDCGFLKIGYTFIGWSTSADGEVEYADGASYTTTTGTDDDYLYAQWELTTYTITYHADGGSTSEDNPTTYTLETFDGGDGLSFVDSERDDYRFDGWYTTEDFETNTSVETMLYRIDTNLASESLTNELLASFENLYAKWTAVEDLIMSYTISIPSQEIGNIEAISDSVPLGTYLELNLEGSFYSGYVTWVLDGIYTLSGSDTSITLDTESLNEDGKLYLGAHTVTAVAYKGSAYYSMGVSFTVTE